MKRLFLALPLLLACAPLKASVDLMPSLGFSTLSGKTDFDITFGGYDPSIDPTYGFLQGESKLEFDLKALMADLGLEARFEKGAYVLSAHYAFAVAKGDGKFRDRDWLTNDYVNNVEGYPPLGGDTLSNVKSPVHTLTLGAGARLARNRKARLFGRLDFERQQLGTFWVYDGVGYYTGWLTGGTYEPINMTFTDPILSYEITTIHLKAGLSGEVDLGPRWTLTGEAKAGLVIYEDFDHHILRQKTGDGSGKGFGYDLGAGVRWGATKRLALGADLRYRGLSAAGKQTQIDHSGAADAYLGAIDQTIRTRMLNLGIQVMYRLGGADGGPGPGSRRHP